MKPLAAVTGATGFLGRHLTEALTSSGWRLRLLVRRNPDLELGDAPIELVPGDLSSQAALSALVREADCIIHAAGAIKAPTLQSFREANTHGTQRLAEIWRTAAPGARFIMLSTLAARQPALSYYAKTKAEAETVLAQQGAGGLTILRPSAVYGPGDRETLPLFKAAAGRFQPLLNNEDARVSLVHAKDVAKAVEITARPGGPEGVFEVTDAQHAGYSWPQIAEAACEAAGGNFRPIRVPRPLLSGLARGGDLAAATLGRSLMLTSQKLREIQHADWSSDLSNQLPDGIWKPNIDLKSGFAETVAWYRAANWMK